MSKSKGLLSLPRPRDLQIESIDLETAFKYVPANALLIVEHESSFLALCSILQDLKRTILTKTLGYVYLGKIGCRWVFVQLCSSKVSVQTESLEILKPNAVIILGFCAALRRTIRIKDLVVAEKVSLKNNNGNGEPLEFQCSEFLLQMFTDGKFGWQQDENHEIHVGNMAASSPKARGAENTRASRMEEAAKASGSVTATWKSSVASQELLRELQLRQEKQSCDWIVVTAVTQSTPLPRFRSARETHEPYLAVALASFLRQVLQDDQVFRLLEANNPSRPSSVISLSSNFPNQESLQTGKRMSAAGYEFNAFKQEQDACSKLVIDQTNLLWQKAKEAVNLDKEKSFSDGKCLVKTPVENIQEDSGEVKNWLTNTNINGDYRGFVKRQSLQTHESILTVPSLEPQQQLPLVNSCFTSVMQTVLPPVGSTLIARGACIEIIDVHHLGKTGNVEVLSGITGPYQPALPPIKENKTITPRFK